MDKKSGNVVIDVRYDWIDWSKTTLRTNSADINGVKKILHTIVKRSIMNASKESETKNGAHTREFGIFQFQITEQEDGIISIKTADKVSASIINGVISHISKHTDEIGLQTM